MKKTIAIVLGLIILLAIIFGVYASMISKDGVMKEDADKAMVDEKKEDSNMVVESTTTMEAKGGSMMVEGEMKAQ